MNPFEISWNMIKGDEDCDECGKKDCRSKKCCDNCGKSKCAECMDKGSCDS